MEMLGGEPQVNSCSLLFVVVELWNRQREGADAPMPHFDVHLCPSPYWGYMSGMVTFKKGGKLTLIPKERLNTLGSL